MVNGHKSNLRLDTGASGILISRSFAEKSGITKISDTTVSGIGDKGEKAGYLALADSIQIGELEFENCPVRVIESRSVVEENGLIGSDVFASFLIDIDFPNEKFKLSELPKRPDEQGVAPTLNAGDADSTAEESTEQVQGAASKAVAKPEPKLFDRYVAPEMKLYSAVFRFGHELLVPTRVGDLDVSKLFLLDTGAFNNLISTATAAEVTKVHNDATIVKGISGVVKNVYRADKATLVFGNLRQQNEDMVAFDLTSLSNSTGTEVSGILGFAMLRLLEIKIDYRDSLVDFNYDTKR
jgi:predicted aspartyl protease